MQLSGSDNIIAFTTHRYQQLPLIIRGPGAGALRLIRLLLPVLVLPPGLTCGGSCRGSTG